MDKDSHRSKDKSARCTNKDGQRLAIRPKGGIRHTLGYVPVEESAPFEGWQSRCKMRGCSVVIPCQTPQMTSSKVVR